jgi:hypothetical protein
VGREAQDRRDQDVGPVRAGRQQAQVLLREPARGPQRQGVVQRHAAPAGEVEQRRRPLLLLAREPGRAVLGEPRGHEPQRLARGGLGHGQHGVDVLQARPDQVLALRDLGRVARRVVVGPQPVAGLERVQAHRELPGAVEEGEGHRRLRHGRQQPRGGPRVKPAAALRPGCGSRRTGGGGA